jgi:tRNA U54 and U55 pseudouridine synthase Pus10
MRSEKSKELLKCDLTEEEFKEFSSTLAKTTKDLRGLEDQKKAIGSKFAAKINEAETEANRIAIIVSDRYEYRDVECETIFDEEMLIATTYRNDTGAIIKSRLMTQEELQGKLFREAQ